MELETINRLYLELSQIATATTAREEGLKNANAQERRLMERLVRGIEAWAADEDGVHGECFDAYQEARNLLGL